MKQKNNEAIEVLAENLFLTKDPHIVTIWGAGASIRSGIPSGYYLMQRMKKDLDLIKDSAHFKDKLKDDFCKVKCDLDSGKDLPLEYVLGIYNTVYEHDALHLWLKNYIPYKTIDNDKNLPFFPGFCHEYCSHLVRSEYLKYFISANFDEILEQTIENEIGSNELRLVASLSEFQRLNNVPINEWESQFRTPETKCFVFKPHGTISRGMTMRDTSPKVKYFESEKRDVLLKVLKGATVVFLGFGNYNENFWHLFGESYLMGHTGNVFIVDKNVFNVKKNFPDARINNKIYEYQGDLNVFFRDIYFKQKNLYNTTKYIRDTSFKIKELKPLKQIPTRHYIRSMFFDLFSRSLSNLTEEGQYKYEVENLKRINCPGWYDRRIYELELLIHLFKSRGLFVQVSASECPRIKESYIKCTEFFKQQKEGTKVALDTLEPKKVLADILNIGVDDLFSTTPVKDRLGKNALNTSWCISLLSKKDIKTLKNFKIGQKNKLEKIFINYCMLVAERYWYYLCEKIKYGYDLNDFNYDKKQNKIDIKKIIYTHEIKFNTFKNIFIKKLSSALIELAYDFDVDINNKDITSSIRFIRPKPIESRHDFNLKTNEILKCKVSNTLKIASTSAEWLGKKLKEGDNETIKAICGFKEILILSNLELFKIQFNSFHYQNMIAGIVNLLDVLAMNQISPIIKWFGATRLQHHMTMVYDDSQNDKNKEKSMALYFRRSGKSTQISPVFLDEIQDLKSLNEYFMDRTTISYEYLTNVDDNKIRNCGLIFTAMIEFNKIEIKINFNTSSHNNVLSEDEAEHLKNWLIYYSDGNLKVSFL